jgi:hypothetical protein
MLFLVDAFPSKAVALLTERERAPRARLVLLDSERDLFIANNPALILASLGRIRGPKQLSDCLSPLQRTTLSAVEGHHKVREF